MPRVRARRVTPRRRDAPRWTPEEWETATHTLLTRDHGRCPVCGLLLTGGPAERHHRLRRRDGGDRLANLLLLHPACHQWVTEHPEAAAPNGWIIRTETDPADVPYRVTGWDGMWLADDLGTRWRVL